MHEDPQQECNHHTKNHHPPGPDWGHLGGISASNEDAGGLSLGSPPISAIPPEHAPGRIRHHRAPVLILGVHIIEPISQAAEQTVRNHFRQPCPNRVLGRIGLVPKDLDMRFSDVATPGYQPAEESDNIRAKQAGYLPPAGSAEMYKQSMIKSAS